jgi:hypothetical protein
MRLTCIAGCVLLGAALAVGCTDQNAPTQPAHTPEINFDFTNGPSTAGPWIVRFLAGDIAWFGNDPTNGLWSINGLGSLNPADSWFCSGGDMISWSVQLLENPATFHSLLLTRENTQHIYGPEFGAAAFGPSCTTFPPDPCWCDAALLDRLAQGTGNFIANTTGTPGAFTQGWRAQGTLDDPANGGKVRYTEEQRVIWNRSGFRVVVENIRLTPIGKP